MKVDQTHARWVGTQKAGNLRYGGGAPLGCDDGAEGLGSLSFFLHASCIAWERQLIE